MHAPLVSIAIPCFNQSRFLFDCLNSLLAQGEARWEAVVVDDCSTEGNVAAIVAAYGDPRLRSIRHAENKGLGAARNTAIRASSAPYILPLDSDDFLDPDFLRATLELLVGESRFDCVFTHLQLVGNSHDIWAKEVGTAGEMACSQWAPGPGTLMRREVWERAGGYCEAAELRAGNEDWDFHIAALETGARYGAVPLPLYHYRRHGGSMSPALRKTEWRTREFIIRRHPDFFADSGRRRRFLSDGYARSAANRLSNGKWGEALPLALQAAWFRPGYALESMLSFASNLKRRVRNEMGIAWQALGRRAEDPPVPAEKTVATRDFWEGKAAEVHLRYGYLSHDYRLLGELLRRLKPRHLLEIGCGSGRLIPVYLDEGIPDIEVEDISLNALELCRRRFAPQTGIRYSHDPGGLLSRTDPVDLIVTNRVLQVLDENELRALLRQACPLAKYFYINELTQAQMGQGGGFNTGRNYDRLFREFGMECVEHGTLLAHDGEVQYWSLFGRTAAPADLIASAK